MGLTMNEKRSVAYDIAVLDLMKPEMDGFELAEAIKVRLHRRNQPEAARARHHCR